LTASTSPDGSIKVFEGFVSIQSETKPFLKSFTFCWPQDRSQEHNRISSRPLSRSFAEEYTVIKKGGSEDGNAQEKRSIAFFELGGPRGEVGTDPISRLEWPWEQTFGVIKLGHNYPGVQINFEGAATLFKDSGLLAQDSDWTDAAQPSQETIFSDALATPRNWTIEPSVSFFDPFLPSIQWLIGYRAQQFRFTYTDMSQR
jgi:hypothetical protein